MKDRLLGREFMVGGRHPTACSTIPISSLVRPQSLQPISSMSRSVFLIRARGGRSVAVESSYSRRCVGSAPGHRLFILWMARSLVSLASASTSAPLSFSSYRRMLLISDCFCLLRSIICSARKARRSWTTSDFSSSASLGRQASARERIS